MLTCKSYATAPQNGPAHGTIAQQWKLRSATTRNTITDTRACKQHEQLDSNHNMYSRIPRKRARETAAKKYVIVRPCMGCVSE